jgi:hypothetical protein
MQERRIKGLYNKLDNYKLDMTDPSNMSRNQKPTHENV